MAIKPGRQEVEKLFTDEAGVDVEILQCYSIMILSIYDIFIFNISFLLLTLSDSCSVCQNQIQVSMVLSYRKSPHSLSLDKLFRQIIPYHIIIMNRISSKKDMETPRSLQQLEAVTTLGLKGQGMEWYSWRPGISGTMKQPPNRSCGCIWTQPLPRPQQSWEREEENR